VIAVSQLNRQSELQDRRPKLSDLRESGAIEQDANTVIFLHRPDENSNLVECVVEKSRNGPTGVVPLTYLPHLMRFENHAAQPTRDPFDGDGF